MSSDRFDKLDILEMGDSIKISFSGDDPIDVNGVPLANPLETNVGIVTKRRLDEKDGHDVDGVVTKKEIHLDIPDNDDVHGEYVIETERPMVGENRVSPIEAREYFEGRPGDGKYSIHPIGFEDIEVLD